MGKGGQKVGRIKYQYLVFLFFFFVLFLSKTYRSTSEAKLLELGGRGGEKSHRDMTQRDMWKRREV